MSRHARHRSTLGYTVTILAAAGVVISALQFAPAGHSPKLADAVLAARTARAARAANSPASNLTGLAVHSCSKAPDGHVVNCPRPVPRALLPAAATSTRLLTATPADLASFVDTRTWTTGGGNTYPGAQAPFGMIQWSPDTLPDRADGGGYSFTDRKLTGYSLTHLSGPGCAAAGDIPILPMTGNLPAGNPSGVATSFSHYGEVAQAGYYSAVSNNPQTITTRITATPHAAIGSFKFPKTRAAHFLIKLRDSQEGVVASHATIVGKDEVVGSETSGDFCHETSRVNGPQRYTVYFSITFNVPFTRSKIITEPGQSDPNSVFLTFNTTAGRTVEAKVGISYVSIRNAGLNWATDIPGWDLSAVQASTQAAWNKLLGGIAVSGGREAITQEFYSLLYKDFLQPNIISDVNGQYFGTDWRMHSLVAGQQNQYGMFSGWDIYHSLAQLQAMLDPADASDIAQSLVNDYSQNRIMPEWGYLNLDNYAQNGDPAEAIIADYYAFGATSFNTSAALSDMVRQADTVNRVRPGEVFEARYGYLPEDVHYGCCHPHAYVSSLLEYDTADQALSQYARAMGHPKIAAKLQTRANNWMNVFDTHNHLLTPKFKNHTFMAHVMATSTNGYLEGDAYEYLWDVPNNYAGLFAKLGGRFKVGPMLRRYLSRPNGFGMHPYFANEFDLGQQFAPDYAGSPSETQWVVNKIRRSLYLPGPSGFNNNDDLGAESSQFIWEMLGMYPENPGSGNLVFASPGFPEAVISLPSLSTTITINAPGASGSRFYVKSLFINGARDRKLYVPFGKLSGGATLDWGLTGRATSWGNAPGDSPPSYYR